MDTQCNALLGAEAILLHPLDSRIDLHALGLLVFLEKLSCLVVDLLTGELLGIHICNPFLVDPPTASFHLAISAAGSWTISTPAATASS